MADRIKIKIENNVLTVFCSNCGTPLFEIRGPNLDKLTIYLHKDNVKCICGYPFGGLA